MSHLTLAVHGNTLPSPVRIKGDDSVMLRAAE